MSVATANAGGAADEELLAACRRGDPEPFGILVERHQDKLFNLAYRLTGDRDEAADAVQEAFLKAWRGMAQFKGESAFYTWVFRILVNEVRSRMRFRAVRPRPESLEASDPADERRTGVAGRLASGAAGPLEEACRAERRNLVESALARLEPIHREVIVLRDVEGRDYGEIADLLDCPRGTVKSRIHRARQALRDLLRPVLESEGDLR